MIVKNKEIDIKSLVEKIDKRIAELELLEKGSGKKGKSKLEKNADIIALEKAIDEKLAFLEEKEKKEEELNNKIKELEEALLRKDADMINYRRRKDEEVERLLKYSNEDIAKDFLAVVDNFERAINLDDDNLDDELSKFLEGFKMIYCHFVDILNKYEIKAIDEVKVPFDPNIHQGVLTEKVEGLEPGMVVEIMQKGYLLKDKVIRHAMVKVSV